MARMLLHGLALAGSAGACVAATQALGLHPLLGPLAAAPLYLGLRAAGRRFADFLGRRLLLARSDLRGADRKHFASALDFLDRGNPDVARSLLSDLRAPARGGPAVYQVWARSCLRLVGHRAFAAGPADEWAGVTAGTRRPLPRLERALLAPALGQDDGALSAEAAVADDRSIAAILGTRALLLGTLLPAVGNPLSPFFPRAEQDLERMLGRRYVLFAGARLLSRARGIQPRRALPPREEAALLLLCWGREQAAAALLASADAAGTLSRRGRAFRTAALVLLYLREEGPTGVSAEDFARRTREIFFLHTRDFAMTDGAAHVNALPDGPRRLLGLLREKRRVVEVLAAEWARRPALGTTLGPLARRIAAGPGEPRPPRTVRPFLRWWRAEGRRQDEACGYNLRGLSLLGEGRPAEATAEFERALDLNPWLEPAAYNLAVSLDGAGTAEGDPAHRLRVLFEGGTGKARAGLLLGEFLERTDRPAEAEAVYRRLLADLPMNAEGNLALGRLLLDGSRPEEAEEALRRANAAAPGDPDVLMALGMVHLDGGRPAEAVPLLRAAVESAEGELREEARWLLHSAFREAEDHERALEALDAVPDRFLRRNEEFLEEAALYLEERRRFDRSTRLFEKLRELRARRGEW
jgi:tetratricopeptide (TPR) repeat protein